MNIRPESGEAVLQATALVPFMMLRLTGSYLHLKREAKRARRTFYHELMATGMSPREAGHLADEYASAVSLRNLLRAIVGRSGRGALPSQ